MELRVKVLTGAREEGIAELSDGRYVVSVKAKPKGGRANARVRELVAEHFGMPIDGVHIAEGRSMRTKTLSLRY